MQIDSVFGDEKIEVRKVIVTVLDHFYSACNSNPIPEIKVKNLSTWHMALEDLTDKSIEAGFRIAVKEDITKLPFPGKFHAMCIIPPKLKEYVEPPVIEMSEEAKKKLEIARENFFKRLKNESTVWVW